MAGHDLDLKDFKKLIALAYGTAFDQGNWQLFLDELTKVTGGVHTHIFGFDIPAEISLGLTASGYAPDMIETYNEYYGEINAWGAGFVKHDAGIVIDSNDMCAPDELLKTEFYNDWIQPQDDIGTGGGALLFKDENRTVLFGGNIRFKDEMKLKKPWLRTVDILIPHLQQAFEICRLMSMSSMERDLNENDSAAKGSGVFFLSENGLVLSANSEGEQLLEAGKLMRLNQFGRIIFGSINSNEILDGHLVSLRKGGKLVAGNFPIQSFDTSLKGVVRVVQIDPEHVQTIPFSLVMGSTKPCLLLIVSPEAHDGRSAMRTLTEIHGLTQSEADVAFGITDGFTISEISEQRGVSIYTIRNQLKSALFKTGARRQLELLAFVERLRRK